MTLQSVIAIFYDCDGTLIKGNMQDAIFNAYNIKDKEFWDYVNKKGEEALAKGIGMDRENAYLITLIEGAQKGIFDGKLKGLSNERLRELGRDMIVFPGLPEFFHRTKEIIAGNQMYSAYGIKVEHYIVSAGLKEMILGSDLCKGGKIENVFASEFWPDENGVIWQIARGVGHMKKTEFLHMVNKGANKDPEINVNDLMPDEFRRVPWWQTSVVGDSEFDVPMMATVNKRKGCSYGTFDPNSKKAFREARILNQQGRVVAYHRAEYQEGSDLSNELECRIEEIAEELIKRDKERTRKSIIHVPKIN